MIRIELSGVLAHRDVALRAVSAACKLVTPSPQGKDWNDFQLKVVSAVGEAFNNIVQHAYKGSTQGIVELNIRIGPGQITIELSDWGKSFDPDAVAPPQLDDLPENGLGLFIIQSFVDFDYRPGQPNVLTLSKTFSDGGQETNPYRSP